MQAYRIKKKISQHGKIELDALPFAEGEIVEIIIFASEDVPPTERPLKGSVLKYVNPTEPVAQDEWISSK